LKRGGSIPSLFKIKAKPWALPKPTREIISLDP
jgi:hypothetical protein